MGRRSFPHLQPVLLTGVELPSKAQLLPEAEGSGLPRLCWETCNVVIAPVGAGGLSQTLGAPFSLDWSGGWFGALLWEVLRILGDDEVRLYNAGLGVVTQPFCPVSAPQPSVLIAHSHRLPQPCLSCRDGPGPESVLFPCVAASWIFGQQRK